MQQFSAFLQGCSALQFCSATVYALSSAALPCLQWPFMLCYSSQPFCSSAAPSCSAVLQFLPFCCAVFPAFLQCCTGSAPPLCSAAVAIFSALWQLTAFMLCNRYQQLCIAAVPSLCVVRQLLFFLPGSAILLRVYHCHAPFPAAAQKYCSFRI